MNNEQQQIIDEAYEDYTDTVYFDAITCIDDVEEYDEQTLDNGDDWPIVVPFSKEKFINKCKTDEEFSKKWGLKIEESEILQQVDQSNPVLKGSTALYSRKLITITYKDKTIESYE